MSSRFAMSVILLWVTIITLSPLAFAGGIRALLEIRNITNFAFHGCSEGQTRALLEIRNSTNGFAFQGWDGKDCCGAPGISCSNNSGVARIYLDGRNWTTSGAWYPNVTLFTLFHELETLDLENIRIGGGLEPFCDLKRLNRLYYFSLQNTSLDGHIPPCLGMIENLAFLFLAKNHLCGTIPQSLTKDGTPIEYLNLSKNKLQGEMLPKGSKMTKLKFLKLNNNLFEGTISTMITNSPSLAILEVQNNQLSGNIPNWLYEHPGLVAIHLSGNRLEGNLLERMCQMRKLRVFDISSNSISGGIPNCLDNITFWKKISPNHSFLDFPSALMGNIGMSMQIKYKLYTYKGTPLSMITALDLSSNKFTGSIPLELGELSQLLSMNLSNNFLTGPLPDSFKNLKKLESLDLSHSKLDGKLPYELIKLTSLSTFSVAYNNLSGRIPFEQQFSTFEIQSYDGNLGLCRKPLLRNCSMTNVVEDEHREQDKDKKEENRMIDNPLLFYAFISVSYALGFWVFFGILIFNKNWRLTYFRWIDI